MDLKSELVIKNEKDEEPLSKEEAFPDEDNVKSEQNVAQEPLEQSKDTQNFEEISTQKNAEEECPDKVVKVAEENNENDGLEVCRLCACDITDKSFCIFEPNDVSFYEKINFSLPISVNMEDEMPSYICEPCKNTLDEVYIFANKVSIANEALKLRFSKTPEAFRKTSENNNTDSETQKKTKEKLLSQLSLKAHYVCHLCGKKFRFEHQLLAHSDDHKDLKSSIVPVCSLCGETFVTEEAALAHLNGKFEALQKCTKIEHNLVDMAYICEFCEKIFVNSNKLMYHKKAEHKLKMYTCGVCSATFTTYARRSDHKEQHVELKNKDKTQELPLMKHYLCDTCGKSYLQYDYLAAHYKLKHRNPSKTYKCQKCKEVYPTGTSISYHYKIKHNVNYFLCPEKNCYNQFTTESALKKHLNDVHKAPVVCYKCGKLFTDKTSLRQHIQHNHAVLFNICEVCGLTFKTMKAFESHKAEHLTGETEKKFSCVICKKLYAYRFELQKHMRSAHSGNFRLLVDMDEDSMDQDVAKSLISLRNIKDKQGTKRSHQEVFVNFSNKYNYTANNAMEVGLLDKNNPAYYQVVQNANKQRGNYSTDNANRIYYKEVQEHEEDAAQVQYCYLNVEGNRKVLLLDNA